MKTNWHIKGAESKRNRWTHSG